MKRSSMVSFTLAGLALLLGSGPTAGQTIPSPFDFFGERQEGGIFGGVTGHGTGRFEFGPKPGLIFGARYGIHLGGPFGLEGVFGYSPTTRNVVDPTRDEGSRVVEETDADLLTLDVRLRFSLTGDRTWRGLNPFVFMGIGLITDAAGPSELDALVLPEDQFDMGTRFVAPFGAGIRWYVSERFLVRADGSISMFQIPTPLGYLNSERGFIGVGEKEWVSGPNFSLGLGLRF